MTVFQVTATGPLATLQDLGRHGWGHIGVSPSGAADLGAHRRANRLVGNTESAATIEATAGGLVGQFDIDVTISLCGAVATVTVDSLTHGSERSIRVPTGARVEVASPTLGLRSYLAVSGGFEVDAVMGSAATDVLSGLGPSPLQAGDVVRVGRAVSPVPPIDEAPVRHAHGRPFDVVMGPRDDDLTATSRRLLLTGEFVVGSNSNRVGLRLEGPSVACRDDGPSRPSEGMVRGAIQVPPGGAPVVFLADHPVTGGYPVVAVVASADLDRLAQLAAGDAVRFRRV